MAKKPEAPERADQCVTLADKIAYSLAVRAKLEALQNDPWASPEDFHNLMTRDDHEKHPWCLPEFAATWARAEEDKARILRSIARDEKRQRNRQLYGKAKRP
jgi:hypothetical protein